LITVIASDDLSDSVTIGFWALQTINGCTEYHFSPTPLSEEENRVDDCEDGEKQIVNSFSPLLLKFPLPLRCRIITLCLSLDKRRMVWLWVMEIGR
jgi:hypothetical protein